MIHKTYIPKRFFSKCKIVNKKSKWINSELVETTESVEFDGAVFNLSRHDVNFLLEQGIQNILDTKKIYCYIDIDLQSKVEALGNTYLVKTERNYLKHDQLRIYYVERLKK